jgi:hypothetical protein
MTIANLTETEQQESLPGIESLERLFSQVMTSAVPTKLISQAYGWDIRTIQLWAKDKVITPDKNGYYIFADVVSNVDHWRVNVINRKMGEEGSLKAKREMEKLDEQVRQLKLENLKLEGKLRDVDKVQRVAFSRARREAEMLNSLPSRLKSILAAETDEFKIGQLLQAEINHITGETIKASTEQW